MKYIANILINGTYGDSALYNVVKDTDMLVRGIPTLIVGWDRTKSLLSNVSILDWRVSDDIYWTFGKRERRDRLEEDSVKFRKLSMKLLLKRVKYVFFNILTASKEEKKEFLNTLNDESKKFVYVDNNMLYVYRSGDDSVYGISLMDIEYEGGNPNRILSMLHRNDNVEFVKETNEIPHNVKVLLNNNRYIIPYLYSESTTPT